MFIDVSFELLTQEHDRQLFPKIYSSHLIDESSKSTSEIAKQLMSIFLYNFNLIFHTITPLKIIKNSKNLKELKTPYNSSKI